MNSIIQTVTPNIEASLDFYQKLNFQQIPSDHTTLVTDGKVIIEINADRFARSGIKLYQASWQKEIAELEQTTAIKKTEDGYVLAGPSGIWIYLTEKALEIDYQLKETAFGMLGNYAGVSLETMDIVRSQALWQTLHFSITMGGADQGWVTFQNADGLGVSLMKPLMCPHLFFNPSLTYFNGKVNNPIVIENIRAAKIPITEEITAFNKEGVVDNIIIRDPGGFGFFIFNDG